MWSRTPDQYEVEALQDYFTSLVKNRKRLDQLYFFVNLDTEDGGIEIIHYPARSIKAMANALECSEREALYCCGHFPGFLNEIRGMLYWSEIGGYKKFTITTRQLNNKEEEVFHDATLYHTSKEKAIGEMEQQGFQVYKIIDVDDEV